MHRPALPVAELLTLPRLTVIIRALSGAATARPASGDEAMPDVLAPMAGTVFEVLVAVGDTVAEGDELIILESMKMEIPVEAVEGGTVSAVAVEPGQPVQENDLLLSLD